MCHILSIRNQPHFFYGLSNVLLKHLPCNPYLGVQFSSDFKWNTHINNMSKIAISTLGFLRRDLRNWNETRLFVYDVLYHKQTSSLVPDLFKCLIPTQTNTKLFVSLPKGTISVTIQ